MTPHAITITAREQAELLPVSPPCALGPKQVRGQTLVTLVSSGTELSGNYHGSQFPNYPGYAAVFRAEEFGAEVADIHEGDMLFCTGAHRSIQQHDAVYVAPVPDGLLPHEAVVARLMGVTMTTLMTTAARPGDLVLVMGAGAVGYLCAHMFIHSGYDVSIVEPNSVRREIVQRSGIQTIYPSVSSGDKSITGRVALVVDCSGHEQAVLDGLRTIRKGAEVVLVGVPWKRRTDLSAHELLSAVFHKYALLRSGWEWQLPPQPVDSRPHSIYDGYRLALRWLAERRIPLEGLLALHDPIDAQDVYQRLLHDKAQGLFQVFNWAETPDESRVD